MLGFEATREKQLLAVPPAAAAGSDAVAPSMGL